MTNSRWKRYGEIFLLGMGFPFTWNYFREHYLKGHTGNSIGINTPLAVKPDEESSENLRDWYLWLNLTTQENRNVLVENHLDLRNTFNRLGRKYPHLQVHDGNFDTLPKCVVVLTSMTIPSSRYCMAKTSGGKYKPEIDWLREDLAGASLEERIVGPTDTLKDRLEYGDNFILQEIAERKYG